LDNPEDGDTEPSVFNGEHEVGKDSEDDTGNPVSESENVDGLLVVVGHGYISIIDPSGTEALEETEEEHEVDSKVMVDDIEVGETPVKAENGGETGTSEAEEESGKLSGSLLAPVGIGDNGGGGFNKRESGINSKHEKDSGEDKGPEVGSSESLNGSGVSNESESNGGGLVLDRGADSDEVTNNGEDSESSEEGEEGVTESDTEGITNDGLVDGVV